MMRPRVQDTISWRRPRRRRLGARAGAGAAVGLVSAAVDLAVSVAGGTGGVSDLSRLGTDAPRVPRDPAQPVADLPCIVVGGTAPWAPASWAGRPHLWATAGRFRVELPAPRGEVVLDPAALSLRSLVVAPGQHGATTLDTRCDATVVGPDLEIVVQGTWLAIAWLGHLAGWPDPGVPQADAGGTGRLTDT
ncbi:hypothetical protein [Isoptericola sp. NPDC055881]